MKKIRFCGHTMGTPELNLRGAMHLFHEIGLDGIEIRCNVDGQLDTERVSLPFIECIKKWREQFGLPIACLTPYYRDFLRGEASPEFIRMKEVIDIAEQLDCRNVRVYGGVDPSSTELNRDENWRRTVAAMRKLGKYAVDRNVRLCVETHIGSLTMTAKEVLQFIEAVDHNAVGVLLDFAWVHLAGQETAGKTISLLGSKIFHCHVKDWHINNRKDHSQNRGCLIGNGDIPWIELFNSLIKSGYQGWISDEYEKYWREAELPSARVGMLSNLSFMKGVLGGIYVR